MTDAEMVARLVREKYELVDHLNKMTEAFNRVQAEKQELEGYLSEIRTAICTNPVLHFGNLAEVARSLKEQLAKR